MNLFLLAQSVAGQTADLGVAAAAPVKELNYIDLALLGGWIMVPLLLLSLVAVYIFVDRFLALRKAAQEDA
jgi:biopolymer transport protein ExbB